MSNNSYFLPSLFLSKYIDRFYVFEKSSSDYSKLPSVLPGTGLELVFYLGKPLSINKKTLPKSHTICPRSLLDFDKVKEVSFLSVRFKSGAFRHFASVSFLELNDSFLSVEKLWKKEGGNLVNRLQNISKIQNKIEAIESFLIHSFNKYHQVENDKWDSIIEELYYNFDNNKIELLSKKLNVSLRQFERGFKSQFGITAKKFQKIARFQYVVKEILLNKNPSYLGTILDSGYFDQSHFIKEFKSLTKKNSFTVFC